MMDITVKIINQSSSPLPSYALAGPAGMDLRTNIEKANITLAQQLYQTIKADAGFGHCGLQ